MSIHRIPRSSIIGALLLGAISLLGYYNRDTILQSLALLNQAQLPWLLLTIGAVAAGFLCAGQIYGRVLARLGYHAHLLWLSAAAMVTILVSQTIPVGSLSSYAFLTTTLRRRGIPASSVALIASLELLSWLGAMLLLFAYGLFYLLVTTGGSGAPRASYSAAFTAVVMLGSVMFVGSRPRVTLHIWALRLKRLLDRLIGPIWSDLRVAHLVDEIDKSLKLILEQPSRIVFLICLQLTIFLLHSLALAAALRSIGTPISFAGAAAAFGLATIVSSLTVLPGGGGTVEAVMAFALIAQGVPHDAAVGATVLFRLCSFWLLLPVGAVCYRVLMRSKSLNCSNIIEHNDRSVP